ncbi:hypothetical protein J2S00_001857 [Caldalkalibacillus uzonensis]|uniref:Uncharacterized protein n=1 Tax=Caldalkalibacillus uzonensis TaxID=353224 RepID=A0ABU0CRM3_9BACI|nr:hypothetical protein [Caldalkalibacillus uzonensis]
MRGLEWIIAVVLVFIGLHCLTVSAVWMFNPESIRQYFITLFRICLWTGIPVIIAVIICLFIKKYNTSK